MPIRYEVAEGVAVITIDRPPVNAFTPALYRELHAVLQRFTADVQARCGILTGAGSKAFSAGHDLRHPKPDRTPQQAAELHLLSPHAAADGEQPNWEFEVLRIPRFKPIIGAVNGPAIGQGLIFLLGLTDLRVAAASARFAFPEIQYGMGGAGGMLQLDRQIPHITAMWLTLTGVALDAQAAERHHLVNEVVPDAEVMLRARQLAARIASFPPAAVRVEMEAFHRARDLTREGALALAQHMFRLQLLASARTEPPAIVKP